MQKVLIIKLGYSETLDKGISEKSSLGDILRTTIILHKYKNDHVTWLVDQKAFPLLKNNKYIKRILPYDLTSVLQLSKERFDTLINFEKVPGICALSDSISAWRRYGFRFDETDGTAKAYDNAEFVFDISKDIEKKKTTNKSLQQILIEMIGEKWNEQEYILGYEPSSKVEFDIGFNWAVGSKWPNKAWPQNKWDELEKLIGSEFTYSRQKGLSNLEDYINWINSCRLLVTNDSLGLHIALALKKQVVALFGPTPSHEIFMYHRGEIVTPEINYDCIPCIEPKCIQKKICMEYIAPQKVFTAIKKRLSSRQEAKI